MSRPCYELFVKYAPDFQLTEICASERSQYVFDTIAQKEESERRNTRSDLERAESDLRFMQRMLAEPTMTPADKHALRLNIAVCVTRVARLGALAA